MNYISICCGCMCDSLQTGVTKTPIPSILDSTHFWQLELLYGYLTRISSMVWCLLTALSGGSSCVIADSSSLAVTKPVFPRSYSVRIWRSILSSGVGVCGVRVGVEDCTERKEDIMELAENYRGLVSDTCVCPFNFCTLPINFCFLYKWYGNNWFHFLM